MAKDVDTVIFRLEEAYLRQLDAVAREQGEGRNLVARDFVKRALDQDRSRSPEVLAELVANEVATQLEPFLRESSEAVAAIREMLTELPKQVRADGIESRKSIDKLRKDLAKLVEHLDKTG